MPATTRTFPVVPLLEAAGYDFEPPDARDCRTYYPGSMPATAARLGTSATSIYRYLKTGGINERAADRLATNLGHHPAEIWADWYDTDLFLCDCRPTHAGVTHCDCHS